MNTCCLQSHIVDSRFYRLGYTTDEARKIFCDYRRFQRWLEVESCLAQCQAELGIIPSDAAAALARTASITLIDLDTVRHDIAKTGHSLIPLLRGWQKVAPPDAGQFINYGATTQDIQDTAEVMELRDVFVIIMKEGREILDALSSLALKHKQTVMIGRTHGQPALPTTFGYKIAIWIDELLRAMRRMDDCRKRVLVSQLFGGVGTMDAFGKKGRELLRLFSKKMGLAIPFTAWHSSRDRLGDFLTSAALLAGSLGRIANELYTLSRGEIAEVEEPFHLGKIGSTTMPHKRNPELCEQAVVLARLVMGNASIGFEGLLSEHERDYRAVRLEWVTVTDTSLFLCGQLAIMRKILSGLLVYEQKMETNARNLAAHITTEALMLELGKTMGKQNAHEFIYTIAMKAHEAGRPLEELLMESPVIRGTFTIERLRAIMDPVRHTGMAVCLTEKMVKEARKWSNAKKRLDTIPHEQLACPLENANGGCSLDNAPHRTCCG